MRVVIEAASLALTSGGLQRYTSELSLALARSFPDDEFYLASDQRFLMPPGAPPNLKRGNGPSNELERRWWLYGLAREMRRVQADVVHGPDFAVPYFSGKPAVMTLHDLSPWMDRRWHSAAARVRRRTPLLLKLGVTTMVITPSEQVRKQAIARFGIEPARITAIPEAAAPWLRPDASAIPPARPYFLFVGTLEPRKNLGSLIEAWRDVRRDYAVDLLLAGRRRTDCPELPQEPGIEFLGEVPDRQLPALYSNALAFVYPSLYEGFGLPVLEAMQCGACVIASRAVMEAAGDAAIYADTPEQLARAMRALLEHRETVFERRALSLARAKEFTWERAARATYQVYREALTFRSRQS